MCVVPQALTPAPDSGAFGEHSVGVLKLVLVEICEGLHYERLHASLVTPEEGRSPASPPDRRQAQVHGANAGHTLAPILTAATALVLLASFTFDGDARVGYLLVRNLLKQPLHQWPQDIAALHYEGIQIGHVLPMFGSGHGISLGSGRFVAPVLP